ncbi:hypothetical protein F5Y08DRAFT_347110 [Xylaria arbuscula]|nr:hypothetical protein F5Y08DRAFT_347148 [Xylaria arbuscula]KAI1357201.1 hypothetical protein F5Y08DRAFT_347110 [Xylaria arbuscula]
MARLIQGIRQILPQIDEMIGLLEQDNHCRNLDVSPFSPSPIAESTEEGARRQLSQS